MLRLEISFHSRNSCVSAVCFSPGFVVVPIIPQGCCVGITAMFYLPPHHCCSVLFAVENEFDLEEIKVAWDFQRKLGNLGMSRAFWNRQWFGLSQRK